MYNRDYRDLLGGGLLLLVGILAVVHAMRTLNLGTLQNMGPGMFPTGAGALLSFFGLLIMIPAFFREGQKIHADIGSFLLIIASIIAFALVMRPFGLVPAITLMTLIASRADGKLAIARTLVFAVCLSIGALLIFSLGLGLPLNAFDWPW